jgi:hypothetical protein
LEGEDSRLGAKRAATRHDHAQEAIMALRTPVTRTFLDRQPDPKEVPDDVVAEIERTVELLRREWDARYPENPVESKEDTDD